MELTRLTLWIAAIAVCSYRPGLVRLRAGRKLSLRSMRRAPLCAGSPTSTSSRRSNDARAAALASSALTNRLCINRVSRMRPAPSVRSAQSALRLVHVGLAHHGHQESSPKSFAAAAACGAAARASVRAGANGRWRSTSRARRAAGEHRGSFAPRRRMDTAHAGGLRPRKASAISLVVLPCPKTVRFSGITALT